MEFDFGKLIHARADQSGKSYESISITDTDKDEPQTQDKAGKFPSDIRASYFLLVRITYPDETLFSATR